MLDTLKPGDSGFDSILVRLKDEKAENPQRRSPSFDSILVRLKETPTASNG